MIIHFPVSVHDHTLTVSVYDHTLSFLSTGTSMWQDEIGFIGLNIPSLRNDAAMQVFPTMMGPRFLMNLQSARLNFGIFVDLKHI